MLKQLLVRVLPLIVFLPLKILSERRNLAPRTQQIIKQLCPNVLHDILAPSEREGGRDDT